MGRQSLKRDAVLGALCAAGVPEPLGVKIVAILADAELEGHAPLCRANENLPRAFVPVVQLELSLMKRMSAEQSCPETRDRQDGYSYARLALSQKARLEGC